MTPAQLISVHRTVALDSNVLIYVLEMREEGQRLRPLFDAAEHGAVRLVLSVVGLAEVLSGPARKQNAALLEEYAAELRALPNLRIVDLDAELAVDAAWLRADHAMALADAVHVASARRA